MENSNSNNKSTETLPSSNNDDDIVDLGPFQEIVTDLRATAGCGKMDVVGNEADKMNIDQRVQEELGKFAKEFNMPKTWVIKLPNTNLCPEKSSNMVEILRSGTMAVVKGDDKPPASQLELSPAGPYYIHPAYVSPMYPAQTAGFHALELFPASPFYSSAAQKAFKMGFHALYYFEVEIIHVKNKTVNMGPIMPAESDVYLGFAVEPKADARFVTISSDGYITIEHTSASAPSPYYGNGFTKGAVVGCGLVIPPANAPEGLRKPFVFRTIDGTLNARDQQVRIEMDNLGSDIWPFVGLNGEGTMVEVNFGQKPFKYDTGNCLLPAQKQHELHELYVQIAGLEKSLLEKSLPQMTSQTASVYKRMIKLIKTGN